MASNLNNLMLAVLIVGYLSVMGWYLKSVMIKKKDKKKSRKSKSRKSKSKHRIAGKRCPGCKRTIDRRRTVCQHCGHKMELSPGVEPHPDEVARGIVAPLESDEPEQP